MSFKTFVTATFAGLICLASGASAETQFSSEIPANFSKISLSDVICGLPERHASAESQKKDLQPIELPPGYVLGVREMIHKCKHGSGTRELAQDHGCCVKSGHHGLDGVISGAGFHVINAHSLIFFVDTAGVFLISDTPFYISENTVPATPPPTRS